MIARLAAVAAAVSVTAVPAAAAPASFPPVNGQLTFASTTGDNVTEQLFSIRPDGSERAALTRIPGNHYQPSWSPDGKRIAFVCQCEHQAFVGVVNADGSDERMIASNETWPPAWSPDGSRLAYSRFDPDAPARPKVWVVRADGSGATQIGPGNEPSWSADGTRLAAASSDRRSIVVYDLPSGTSRTVAIASSDHSLAWPAWSPRTSEIAYTETGPGGAVDEHATVHLVDASGANGRLLVSGALGVWAPDGQALAVESSTLEVVRLDGTVEGRVADGSFTSPTWSPDGKFLAYASVAAPSTIYVVRRDGSERRQLTHEVSRSSTFYPRWSPDGTRILFASVRSTPDADIYSIPGDDGGVGAVTLDDDVDQVEPAWSPDGTRLAYVEHAPTMGAASTQLVRIVVEGRAVGREGDHSPAWSPDGARLALVNGNGIWVERANGTRRRRVATGQRPAWSPDGRSLAFVTQVGALAVVRLATGRSGVVVSTVRLKAFLGAAEAGIARSPTWAPDGRTIAFIGIAANWHAPAVVSVVLATPRDGQLTVLASGLQGGLAWSPDGAQLAATADDHIVLVDARAGGTTPVAPDLAGWSADPAWRPVCGLRGTALNDTLRGSAGSDLVCGYEGNDRITGGRGRDRLLGGAGSDVIAAADGMADVIGSGSGRDTVVADRSDLVGPDCERVRRLARRAG